MAEEKKYPYAEALRIAEWIKNLIAPYCERVEIAGSIRREKPEVGDIELVAIPKPYMTGLFEDGIASVLNKFTKVTGELEYGKCKYTQRILPEGIKLDLFFAEKGNWGNIFAIRTGSADYNHKVLAGTWSRLGYKSENGYLYKDGVKIEIPEEKDLFDMLKMPFIEPKKRL